MNFGFIIDNRKCIGCHACTVACKAEHDVPIGVNRTWVKYIEKGEFPNSRRVFSVMRCNHCEDAPCVEICPVEALFIRPDGIVDFDNRRCIGCKACTQACPYDSIYIDPETHTAAKCNYCAHRIDVGLEPACVNVCPEHAIISGDLDDPNSEISQLLAREPVTARKVEKGTRPKLFYIDGDEASLKPITTPQVTEFLWSEQSSGVGHYAKFAEKRLQKADPQKMAQQLSQSNGNWVGEGENKVLIPGIGETEKMQEKASHVIREKARRVYDAPKKGVMWGWEVSSYIITKAVAAGALLIPGAAIGFNLAPVSESLQWVGIVLSLVFLGLTGLLLIKDLDQPKRFAYVLLRPHFTSWLVRGGYLITVFGGLVTLFGVAKFLQWSAVATVAMWGSMIFAILVAIYTAFLFAQAKGRDFWQSPMLVFHMFGHAIVAGSAVFLLITPFLPQTGGVAATLTWMNYLSWVLLGGIVFNAVIVILELIMPHPTEDAHETVALILHGPFKKHFWLGTILIGTLLPLALILMSGLSGIIGAAVLSLVGMYITEHIWVRAPQLIPLS